MPHDGVRTLGFIGTGVMGAPMVKRLLGAKFAVRVWNRSPSKLEPLVAAGASRVDTPADAAGGCDAVLLCLSDAPAVQAALFEDGGVAHAATPPAVLIDFSAIGPNATHAVAERLRSACGTGWVDAPVSGGAAGAEQGRLVIFCGGSAADVERFMGVFEALALRVTRVRELGAGQTLKLCDQLIVASNLVAVAESLDDGACQRFRHDDAARRARGGLWRFLSLANLWQANGCWIDLAGVGRVAIDAQEYGCRGQLGEDVPTATCC